MVPRFLRPIASLKRHAICEAVEFGIVPRNRQRSFARIDANAPRQWALTQHRKQDCARTDAEIQHERRLIFGERFHCHFNKQFRLRPWREHVWSNFEIKRPERFLTEDMADRFARFATQHQRIDGGGLLCGDRTTRIGDDIEPRDASARLQQQPRIEHR